MPSLSIVIPAYNEETRLPTTLQRIIERSQEWSIDQLEVVVVDDGSTDGTAAVVSRFAADQACIKLLRNPGNRGKGYAVRHGVLAATGEWILFTDADLSAPIEELETLRRAACESGAPIVIGSRALDRSLIGVHQSHFREWSGRVFNAVMRRVTGLEFSDTQCGFKLYHGDEARAVFRRQKLDGFSFDVEHLVIAKRMGILVIEVPVRWNNVEGTKVSALAGIESFADLLRICWNAWRGVYD